MGRVEEIGTNPHVLYQCRVILNPKNSLSMKPACRLVVKPDALVFEVTPPLCIPFSSIRAARVHQLTDGIVEHGDRKTVFRGTSIWTGVWEAPKIIQIINHLKSKGTPSLSSEDIRTQFGFFENHWIFFIVAVTVGSLGGAVGGLWGGVFGFLAQLVISRKPKRSMAFKIIVCFVAIIGTFIAYFITVLILAQIFPGLIKPS